MHEKTVLIKLKCKNIHTYLIVPVGEGHGLLKMPSPTSGMLSFSGGRFFFLGLGGELSSSFNIDWKTILMLVLGNLRTQL